MLKALRLSPFGLVGVGFSLPGTPPVRKSAAWVELSENVSDKSGCVFVQLLTPKVAPSGGLKIYN